MGPGWGRPPVQQQGRDENVLLSLDNMLAHSAYKLTYSYKDMKERFVSSQVL